MIVHLCKQGSEEWHKLRDSRVTASIAYDIQNLKFNIVQKKVFANEAMKRGTEFEPVARAIYELETGREVEQVGFVEFNKYIGCSPDGFIDNRQGLIEIKCRNANIMERLQKDHKIDTRHWWQMQMQMLICQCKYCDYVVWHDEYDLYVQRVYADEEAFNKLLDGFKLAEFKFNQFNHNL